MSFNFRKARHGGRITEVERTFAGTAFLPVPSNLVDSLGINYNDAELGLVGGGIANFVQDVGGDDIAGAANAVKNKLLNTSPNTAPLQWPTCIGPVGFADTNSIL